MAQATAETSAETGGESSGRVNGDDSDGSDDSDVVVHKGSARPICTSDSDIEGSELQRCGLAHGASMPTAVNDHTAATEAYEDDLRFWENLDIDAIVAAFRAG